MAWLRYYDKEHKEFKDAYDKKLTYEETRIVFMKLCRHFKIFPYLEFGRSNRGNRHRVQLSHRDGRSFGILCHELSHTYTLKKYDYSNKRYHDKRLWRTHKRMINYCRKRNFWEEELKNRTEIKIKPEPTKEEIQGQKIEKTKKDIERYKKRLAYFNKLYTNKIKKSNKRLSMLEFHQKKQSIENEVVNDSENQ